LTQALAAQNEKEENNFTRDTFHDRQEAFNNSLNSSLLPNDKESNGVKTARKAAVGTEKTAAAASASAGNIANASSLTNVHLSSSFNVNMARVTSMLSIHHALSNGFRPRGTSLERTDKEKKLEGSPKGTYSTNPGDTALPPSPESPIILDSNNPPTEGVRATYRSWRDVRPGIASEKAWSIGEQDSGISQGQVERSITEAMTGAEPNNRSRKASHTLRFFKEALPEENSRKGESKSRGRSTEEPFHGKVFNRSDASQPRPGQEPFPESNEPQEPRTLQDRGFPTSPLHKRSTLKPESRNSFNPAAGFAAREGYFDTSHSIETLSEEQVKSIPPQLLADIRRHHNVTPGAAKGSSFSGSIPVTASERSQSVARGQGSDTSKASAIEAGDSSKENGAELTRVKSNEDEDESGEEQISSALFVPHHTPLESSEVSHLSLEKAVRPRLNDQRRDASSSQQWLEQHQVPSREIERKYVRQEAHSQLPPVRSPGYTKKEEPCPPEKESLSPTLDTLRADHATTDDESVTVEQGFGVAGTIDTIPAGSLKSGNQIPPDYLQHFHDHQNESQQPLEAIELIPYRHQVGGHTTLWRFSKRAVAKQLSNRENEFYEKVERYHPQLLKFLPRYVFSLVARGP
jgi:hypothetical protein